MIVPDRKEVIADSPFTSCICTSSNPTPAPTHE